ncbi:universal stress protein [Natronococcus wangiae]|uniref:universal stress protein n=1 Tax=Natronococcus wangiae TaxID=3068275 RepID=UPI00273FC0CA|nr:universal stress protein [Natronococcus sp. AD5]
MVSTVLVPMDDSEMATKALEFAIDAHPNANITVLHVVGGLTPYMGGPAGLALADDIDELARERSNEVFTTARDVATKYDKEIETAIDFGQPAEAIIKQAKDFDVVVIGAHTHDLVSRFLVGNVASTVSRDAPVPVTVVR